VSGPELAEIKEGSYSLRVVDANGCFTDSTFIIEAAITHACKYPLHSPPIMTMLMTGGI
jgi:hypothetical protein